MTFRERCLAILRDCSMTVAASNRLWSLLEAAYGEPQRHYHTLQHIAAMLHLSSLYRHELRDPVAVDLAILFHDVVYDPARNDNEFASAALARRELSAAGVPRATIERVEHLIDLTRHGAAEPGSDDQDALLFVDWDLSILGAAAPAYDAYAAGIRREYAHIEEAAFRTGRAHVIQAFLARPAIYRTARHRADWERPARTNLEREHAALSTA